MLVPLVANVHAADAATGVPSAPSIGVTTAGNNEVTVTWTVPADNGSPIEGFSVDETLVSGSTLDGTTNSAGNV